MVIFVWIGIDFDRLTNNPALCIYMRGNLQREEERNVQHLVFNKEAL